MAGGRAGEPVFDPRGPGLVYVAIAEVLERRVRAGTCRPGMQLPAGHRLAAAFGAAREACPEGDQDPGRP